MGFIVKITAGATKTFRPNMKKLNVYHKKYRLKKLLLKQLLRYKKNI